MRRVCLKWNLLFVSVLKFEKNIIAWIRLHEQMFKIYYQIVELAIKKELKSLGAQFM